MVSVAEFLSTPLASITVTVRLQEPLAAGAVKVTCELPSVKVKVAGGTAPLSLPWTSISLLRLPAQVVVHATPMAAVWPLSGSCAVAPTVTVAPGETKSELAVNESITGASLEIGIPGASWFMSMMTMAVAFVAIVTLVAVPW